MISIDYCSSEADYRRLFHDTIPEDDKQTLRFSKESLDFQSRFYSFTTHPVMMLTDEGEASSVLFLNYTKTGDISIINIVSKAKFRGRGHAALLMARAVRDGYLMGKKRLRMNCDNIPGTIKFYSKLGFVYWGVTPSNALYCNVPIWSGDISELQKLVKMPALELIDNQKVRDLIYKRCDSKLSEKVLTNPPEWLDPKRYLYRDFTNTHAPGILEFLE